MDILLIIGIILATTIVSLFIFHFFVDKSPHANLVKRLAAEKQRAEQAEQDAKAADRAKGRFLTHMSHEIRTPINAVLGMDEMIIRETHERAIRNYALDIRNAGNILLTLVGDILDFSKIESGQMDIVPVDYSLSSIICDVTSIVSPRIASQGLEFVIEVDPELPSLLHGDDMRLKQVLAHLLINAAKYTRKGTVTLTVRKASDVSITENFPFDNDVANSQENENIELFFEVRDTGIGIKDEDKDKLFVEFFRIEESRNRQVEGSGLGLNITSELLKLMGSHLEFTSVYGQGSSFFFTIAQKIVSDEPVGDFNPHVVNHDDTEEYRSSFIAPGARVLVVDDDEMNRRVFASLLKETKVHIIEAVTGEAAVSLASQEYFDIIFMDHLMPGIDGVDAMREIRAMEDSPCADTPIIILTANAIAGARENFLSKGFDDFLSKPVNPALLEEMLHRFLPKRLIMESSQSELSDEECSTDGLPASDLPFVDGLDWSYARLHFKNDKLMYNIIDFFCSTIESNAFELESLFPEIHTDNGRRHYQTKVHSMKSSASTIGIVPLAGLAKVLEDAAKNSDYETLETVHPLFLRKWRGYREVLAQFIKSSKPEKSALDNKEEVNALLKQLHDAADDMDIDLLDDAMSELNEYYFPDEYSERITNLRIAVNNFDVDYVTENTNFTI